MRRLFESLQKSDGDGIQTAPLVIAWCVRPTFTLLGTSRQNAKVNGQPLRLDNKTCIIRKNLKTYRHLGIETAGRKCFGQVWGVNYCCRVVIRSVSFPRKSSPHLATTIPYPYPVQVLYNGRTNSERREPDCFRAISVSNIQPSRGYKPGLHIPVESILWPVVSVSLDCHLGNSHFFLPRNAASLSLLSSRASSTNLSIPRSLRAT